MTVKTAFELRLHRAKQLQVAGAVEHTGNDGAYKVKSQHGKRRYTVHLRIDHSEIPGFVLEAQCTCPDWRKMNEWINEFPMNPGLAVLNGNVVCKHVLACCLEEGVLDG